MRAVLELLLTIIAVVVARAVLSSLMRGMVNAGRMGSASPPSGGGAGSYQQQNQTRSAQPTGELHKDPVCGTYVAQSTPFWRQASGQMFYYCSVDCKEKHALAASR